MIRWFNKYVRYFLSGIALICFMFNVSAESPLGLDEDKERLKQMQEEAPVVLPAFPAEENLLYFDVSPMQTMKFAIDSKSLVIAGHEVRYTLVATSSFGAKNISYEGIRCFSYETRRYAYGHKDGWKPAKNDKWRRIQSNTANRSQAALVQDYFCTDKMIEGKPEDMLDRIRYRRSLYKKQYHGG